jgi:dolichol kinase
MRIERKRAMFGLGEEGDDEDDEDEDEDETGPAAILFEDVGEATSASFDALSAHDSSITYAAGPSESGGRRDLDDVSSSDVSSSERHPFDWDVPNKRMSAITPSNSTQANKRNSRNFDEPSGRTSSPFRRTAFRGETGGHQTGDTPPTPTQRKKELEDESGQSASLSASGRVKKTTDFTNGPAADHGGVSISALTSNLVADAKPLSRFKVQLSRPSNPTIEAGLLVVASLVVAIRLGRYPDEEMRTHASEVLVLIIASSALYACLLPGKRHGEDATIWATSARHYRSCGDDGMMCGLLLGPLLAVTCLFASLEDRPSVRLASGDGLPFPPWRVESPPLSLGNRTVRHPSMTALALSRCTLLSLQTAMSTTLLLHLIATKWIRKPSELKSGSWARLWSYIKFSLAVSLLMTLLREAFAHVNIPLWTGLTRMELINTTLFFQSNLYTITQLARRSFTLGELAVVACVGVTLSMETLNLTSARLMPATTPYIKTFRRPTPLLIFQLALVVGTFMIGFLLSPLLYLSRHLAQKPVHRLRWPHKRDLHRRLLAFFFYLFSALYVVGVLGLWVYWMLGKKNPWLWTLRFVVNGRHWWSRPALITFWVGLVSLSVAGWQATVSSGKRFRIRQAPVNSSQAIAASSSTSHSLHASMAGRLGLSGSPSVNLSGNDSGEDANRRLKKTSKSTLATDNCGSSNQLFPKRAAYLSLNARRKSFHALAVLLFVPGIAFDPAFTHLAFSLAFSVFIFAEYIRYYAIYPFGAALHVFLSEFTDHKDSGPVILSHFYLLTGCAGGLWIEGLHGQSTRAGRNVSQMIVESGKALASSTNETLWTSLLGTFGWADESLGSLGARLSPSMSGKDGVDISMFIGVLTLGIGDALASIIGRRYGRMKWPANGKTVEGTIAFVVSIYVSAIVLRLLGWCAPFSLLRFAVVSVLLGLIEGISNQNDNLVLPMYGVIALSVLQV